VPIQAAVLWVDAATLAGPPFALESFGEGSSSVGTWAWRSAGIGAVVLLALALVFEVDPRHDPQGTTAGDQMTDSPSRLRDRPTRDSVSVVLPDTEDTWRELFRDMNREYREPSSSCSPPVQSVCGLAGSATGLSSARATTPLSRSGVLPGAGHAIPGAGHFAQA